MSTFAVPRQTAEERRETVLLVAMEEFALRGLDGTSTDDIARRAGISQPYLFRLFGTKKQLFVAAVTRCLEETLALFRSAAGGRSGEDVLDAIGEAYVEILSEPTRLRLQMQAYAACDDPEIREVVRAGFGRLVEFVEQASGVAPPRLSRFFARGMLLNVVASMDLLHADERWARMLIDGCREEG
jgi:AcrR family transcriptional regulator